MAATSCRLPQLPILKTPSAGDLSVLSGSGDAQLANQMAKLHVRCIVLNFPFRWGAFLVLYKSRMLIGRTGIFLLNLKIYLQVGQGSVRYFVWN